MAMAEQIELNHFSVTRNYHAWKKEAKTVRNNTKQKRLDEQDGKGDDHDDDKKVNHVTNLYKMRKRKWWSENESITL